LVYSYGLAPPSGWQIQNVGEDYEWQVGELGGFKVHRRILDDGSYVILSEGDMGKRIIDELENNDAMVTYLTVDRVRFWEEWLGKWAYDYRIECVFKGSPIAWFVVVGILIALGLIAIVAAPIIWKYSGLSPEEVEKYLNAFIKAWKGAWDPIIILAIIFVIALFFIFGGEISKKGIKGKGR